MLLSGCETALRVGVRADDRGGGRVVAAVTLDRAAQRVVGDNLSGQLRVDDLEKAGWEVDGPTKSGSDLVITATKRFASSEGAALAVRELDAGGGLFREFSVTQDRGFLRTTTRFSGTVDLRRGIEAFSDETLRRELGSPLGATPEEFATRIGSELETALPITVEVALPGESASWHPKLGERMRLATSAEKWNVLPIALAALAVFAAGTALMVGLGGRRSSA